MKPTPSALKWLAENRARTANELEQVQSIVHEVAAKAAVLEQDLAALDRSLRVFDSRINPSDIEPVNGWRGNYGKRGELRKFILETLKSHYPDWMGTNVVGALVIAHFGLTFELPKVRADWYAGSFRGTLKKLVYDGLLESEAAHTAQAALAEAQKRADGLAALLEQERAATKEARAKAEKALTDAAKLAGKLEALQPAKATKKQA